MFILHLPSVRIFRSSSSRESKTSLIKRLAKFVAISAESWKSLERESFTSYSWSE